MAKYHVEYERDPSGRWVGSVREVQGCHSQGRTIAQTRERVREALGLFVDDANRVELIDDIKMPAAVKRTLEQYAESRARAERVTAEASAAARRAVQALAGGKLNLSRRDAGELLGLSHQRVQQLLEDA
jgi:predicted RNase H-like HicB family nuclease